MKVHGPAATLIQPLVNSTPQGGTVTLAKFGQPNENIGIGKKSAQRIEFPIRRRLCIFGQDDTGNVRTRCSNHVLKRRYKWGEHSRIQLEQNHFAGCELQRGSNSPGTFIVICSRHFFRCSWIAAISDGIVDSAGTMSGFKPNSCAASRVTGPITARAVRDGSERRSSGMLDGLVKTMQSTRSDSRISPMSPESALTVL